MKQNTFIYAAIAFLFVALVHPVNILLLTM